jgi:hypothetical protein
MTHCNSSHFELWIQPLYISSYPSALKILPREHKWDSTNTVDHNDPNQPTNYVTQLHIDAPIFFSLYSGIIIITLSAPKYNSNSLLFPQA